MRKGISILFIVFVLLPSLIKFAVLIDFKINQDFIAQELCVEKDVPESTCNGKCHLSKQLKKVEPTAPSNEDKAPARSISVIEVVYFVNENVSLNFSQLKLFNQRTISLFRNEIYDSNYIVDIFHPPQFS